MMVSGLGGPGVFVQLHIETCLHIPALTEEQSCCCSIRFLRDPLTLRSVPGLTVNNGLQYRLI